MFFFFFQVIKMLLVLDLVNNNNPEIYITVLQFLFFIYLFFCISVMSICGLNCHEHSHMPSLCKTICFPVVFFLVKYKMRISL